MKKNITLIGMPGAGKSTVGIILAKNIAYGFLDTDVLIQINNQSSLQDILNKEGYLALRKIEEREIVKINIDCHVIATGGSAVYSNESMKHLQSISTIIFLSMQYKTIYNRVRNFEERGIAKSPDQTIHDLYQERNILYNKYADIVIETDKLDQEEIALLIQKKCRY